MDEPKHLGILFFIERLANELDCSIEEAQDLMAEAMENIVDLRDLPVAGSC